VELTTGLEVEARGGTGKNLPSLYVEPEKPTEEIAWPALEFNDVFKIYESGSARTVALRGLDLRVERGEMVSVVGPSGSGKSTALALAGALERPSAGDVTVAGHSLAQLDEAELAQYRAQGVAIVFQADNLWPGLSARENVATALRLAGRQHVEREASDALRALGLSERAHLRPRSLSGGEHQRVAIAAAAARRAPLVLADEPTGELDERNEATVLRSLADLRDRFGSTIVVVTHSERVAGTCDRVVELRDGRVIQ
jgi:putative ABC transport system ATP-binding protein